MERSHNCMSMFGFCAADEISFSIFAPCSGSRATMMTVSPVFASSRAMAFPIPDVTPVTIYTFVFIIYLFNTLYHQMSTETCLTTRVLRDHPCPVSELRVPFLPGPGNLDECGQSLRCQVPPDQGGRYGHFPWSAALHPI